MKNFYCADRTAELLGITIGDAPELDHSVTQKFNLVMYYGDWSPKGLEASPIVRKVYRPPVGFPFYKTLAESGYYAVRTSILEKERTWDQQIGAPRSPWQLCPAVIGITAALLMFLDTEDSFLDGKSGSCAENLGNGGHRPALSLEKGILMVNNTARLGWDGHTFPMLKRIECRKIG